MVCAGAPRSVRAALLLHYSCITPALLLFFFAAFCAQVLHAACAYGHEALVEKVLQS
jgi:hypothetical protein